MTATTMRAMRPPRPSRVRRSRTRACAWTLAAGAVCLFAASLAAADAGDAFAILEGGGSRCARLVHLPSPSSDRAGVGGVLREVASFDGAPSVLAWSDERVYVVFPPGRDSPHGDAGDAGPGRRRVLSGAAAALASASADALDTEPSLPGDGRLVGVACTANGPVALLVEGGEVGAAERPRLLLLEPGGWRPLEVPPGLDAGSLREGALSAAGAEVRVLAAGKGSAPTLWTSTLGTERGEVSQGPWRGRAFSGERSSTAAVTGWVDGWLVEVGQQDGGGLLVSRIDDRARTPLVVLGGAGAGTGAVLAPRQGTGSAVVLWPTEPSSSAQAAPPRAYEFREVGLATGVVLYTGQDRRGGRVSQREIGVFTLGLVLVTGAVLVTVVRSHGAGRALPAGATPAGLCRRVGAAMIDFSPGLALACWTFGQSPAPTLDVIGIASGGVGPLPLFVALGAAAAHACVCEWRFGQTIGKALTGCRVVVVSNGERPSLPRAVVRNAARWGVPPLMVAGALDPSGRHLGDLLAGTAVIRHGARPARGAG